MIKSRRMISSLLALTIGVLSFGGCNNATGTVSSSNSGGTNTSATPEVSSAAASAAPEGDQKTGGEITIFQNFGKVQSAGKPGSTDADFKEVQQYILDKTGIKVNVIIPPKGEETTKLNMMLASKEPFDLFNDDWTKYADKKVIQPITEQIEKYGSAIVESWGEIAMSQTTDKDGQIWGVPRMAPLVTYPVYVREDWLKAAGLEAPKTTDELEAVLKAFKEMDPAGNGTTIPMISVKGEDLHRTFAAGFTGKGYGFYKDTDNHIKPSVMDPNFKDYLSKMNDWYNKGYLFKEALATDGNTAREIIKKGQVGVSAMWYSAITIQSPYIQPPTNYILCAPLEGPRGKCETTGTVNGSAALIPAISPNADAVVQYINWLHEDIENNLVAEDGIKDKHWRYTDESIHEIEILNENYIGEFVGHQGIGLETQYSFSDPIKKMHYDYIRNEIQNLDRGIKPDTFDVLFNNAAIQQAVPNLEDIKRMIEEENTKFITGTRPLSEYDAFIKELESIGIDQYIDELTRQYNEG